MANSAGSQMPAYLGAIAFGSEAGQAVAQYGAMTDDSAAIDANAKLTQLKYLQMSIANYDSLDKLIASQKAMASVRGYQSNSPSFNAIQRETYSAAGRSQNNLNTEKSIADLNARIERSKVKDKFAADLLGDITDIGKSAINLAK